MKKVLFIIMFSFLIGLYACGQRSDGEFTTPITVTKIIFPDGTFMTTAPVLGSNVTWNTLAGKPTFATVATSGSYNDLKDLPQQTPLATALQSSSVLPYGNPVVQKTTAEIAATVPPANVKTFIFDTTLGVLKFWDGTKWKIIITNQ